MKLLADIDTTFAGIAKDYVNGGLSRSLFQYAPSLQSVKTRAERISEEKYNREDIADALMQQNREWLCGEKTVEHINKLRKKNCVIVSCGHQACLLGGPLFVLYKTLTAINTALLIEEKTGIPAVPLFWLATDDDDIPEVVDIRSDANRQISFLPKNYKGVVGYLPSPEREVQNIPSIGCHTWEEYHAKLLHSFFNRFGLILASPLHKLTRELRAPFFRKYLPEAAHIREAIENQTATVLDLGFKAQVKLKKNDSLIYRMNEKSRERLMLKDLVDADEYSLMSSALTRLPSLEYCMPIAAEISGPSEVAYHAQTKGLYDILEREMPPIILRSSLTLIRTEWLRTIQKSGVDIADIMLPRNKIGINSDENSVNEILNRLDSKIADAFDQIEEDFTREMPELATAFTAAKRRGISTTNYLRKKVNKNNAMRFVNNNTNLFKILELTSPPDLQERHFAYFPFIEKKSEFIGEIIQFCMPFNNQHHIVEIGD